MYAIWNLTNICPWDCALCCMSSRKESERGSNKKELTFKSKMKILETLVENDIEIDFSGGDPLFYPEDFQVVSESTKILKKEKLNVSMTGCGFNSNKLNLLKKIGKVEISIDNVPGEDNPFRPKGFNYSAISVLEILAKEGVSCSAVTTLYPNTIGENRLRNFYEFLCSKNIPRWDVIQFYLVGRGAMHPELILEKRQLLYIMNFLSSLKGSTKIVFQHSLRVLRGQYQCHAAVGSIGILPDGTIVSCGWALDKYSNPLDGFTLGKLPSDNLSVILRKAVAEKGYCERPDYCRIINYLKKEKAYGSK